ncbi:MAG TPA: MFS transporter [Pyrinomonadaceae bacterium]|jgi:ACS family hexuronate transporter-like MFS transporter
MQETKRDNSAIESGFKLSGLRWWIIGLIFFVTLINYIDRLTISVLAPVITKDLGLSNTEFGTITTWFLLAYTISQAVSGKFYDRVGNKIGFIFSVVLWSIAAILHAFAGGLASLSVFRFILGFGEAGNFPGAAKVNAEWFPQRERALAQGIFNSGVALGSIVAPPLIIWLQLNFGWKTTFIATGALGFLWLVFWVILYKPREEHPWLTENERDVIESEEKQPENPQTANRKPQSYASLLGYKQTWAIVLARFLGDPVWWLYITWLPKYLYDARGFDLKQIGLFAWVPFVAAGLGSVFGGWLAGYFIGRGWSVDRARKVIIGFSSLLTPAGIIAAYTSDAMLALAMISVVLFGFQVWINNVQTLPSDFFPKTAVGSVAGLGGMGAGVGSMIFIFTTGWVVDSFSYVPILVAAGLLVPLGTMVLFALSGRIQKVQANY